MLSVTLPADIEQFVHQTVAEGGYANEEEVVTDAIRFLRDSKTQNQGLRDEIAAALAEVDGGLGIEIDDDGELAGFFDELEAEVHEELVADKKAAE